MTWALLGVATAGWAVAIYCLVFRAGETPRRTGYERPLRLRTHVEAYLLRKASEAGIEFARAADGAIRDEDKLVDDMCKLAQQLTEHDRQEEQPNAPVSEPSEVGVSDTVPLQTPNAKRRK